MNKRLALYGSGEHMHGVAMVGKGKTVNKLAARMPSPGIVAKVGAIPVASPTGAQIVRVLRLKSLG